MTTVNRITVAQAHAQADRNTVSAHIRHGSPQPSIDAESDDLAGALEQLRTILPHLGATRHQQAALLRIIANLLDGQSSIRDLDTDDAVDAHRAAVPSGALAARHWSPAAPGTPNGVTLPLRGGSGSMLISPHVTVDGALGGNLTHTPVLRFDDHGHLWVGPHGSFEDVYDTEGTYIGPRPVIEIAHLCSHGGLVVVITELDVFVMTEAEYQAQV